MNDSLFESFFRQKKAVIFCRILGVLCFVAAFLSIPFMFQNLQEKVIAFGENLIGRNLNVSFWHKEILVRARYLFLLSIILGIGFFLLSIVCFDKNSSFSIKFGIDGIFYKNRKFLIAFIIAFSFIASIRVFWFSQKQSLHADELFEIGIINRNEYGFWRGDRFFYEEKDFEKGVPVNGLKIKENVFFNDGSLKDCLKDIIHLYICCNDNPHTDLYYILQRLAFLGTKTFNQKTIFIRSFILNFLIFIFSFYIMFLLVQKLTDNKFLQITILIASFANPASVSVALFFRPFILQEFALILFAYIFLSFYIAIKNKESVITKKAFIQGALVLGFTLVSEYFSLFFIALLGLSIILLCIRQKKIEAVSFFITMFFVGFIVAKIFYPDFGIGFFDSRHDYALVSIKDNLVSAFITSKNFINNNFIPFVIFLPLFIFNIISFMIFLKDNEYESSFVLVVCTVIYIFLCNFFAPFKNIFRYVAPSSVFLPIILICLLKVKSNIKRFVLLIFQISILLIPVLRTIPFEQNRKYIEHLDDAPYSVSHAEYNKNAAIPVVVEVPLIKWAVYPYVNENQLYYFTNSMDEVNYIKDSFWYISTRDVDGGFSFSEELINKNNRFE